MNRLTTPRQSAVTIVLSALILTACSSGPTKNESPGPAALGTGLNPLQSRITDERILADRRTLDNVQQRLRKLSETGIPQSNYSLAKAQCWLDTAKSQYHENDRTGYIEESLTEAVKITKALEADKSANAGFDTPLVARSTMLRNDLWAQLGAYKNQPVALACNAKTVACAEVRLVRAGHANEQTGWRQATPWIQMVEDALVQAKAEAEKCAQVTPKPIVSAAVVAPATSVVNPVAPAPTVTKETYVVLADTLFRFNKSGKDEMLPGGLQRLADVAQRLKAYKSIQTLTVVGYTDRLGSDAYNDKLSDSRARSVKEYLESLGVKSASSVAQGKGKREPMTKNCSTTASRIQQIVCLQPDRRVTIEVSGMVQ